ncbi:MAG: CotH kinase family protein [Flavobacteriales bacterium]|nr:CotH kinase family protein [Flavobacteriales bacterium]
MKTNSSFIKLTLIFSIVGIFIPEHTEYILLKSQRVLDLLGLEFSIAWITLWTLTSFTGLILPFIFYYHISSLPKEKHKWLIIKLTLFNLIEYILLQSSLTPLFTDVHTIIFNYDVRNGMESIYTAWLALPILVLISTFFNQKLEGLKSHFKIPKGVYFFIGLLILFHLFTAYTKYDTNGYNQLRAISIEQEESEINENRNCLSINVNLDKKTLDKHDSIVNSIFNELKVNRLIYYFIGNFDPYETAEALMPKLKYDPAIIKIDNSYIKAKIKLTGGKPDHFITPKRSLRIKLKDTTLLGMTKFNLYDPSARLGGLYEWANTELMRSIGLIGLKTGYASVTINDKKPGTFFYQEQPTIQTLTTNNRKPGLIIRIKHSIDKDGFTRIEVTNYYDKKSLPSKKYFKEQNDILENKIRNLDKSEIGIDQLISIPKMAKYLACIDLCNGYHGARFRNLYFYFNPSDSLLEPIGREFGTNQTGSIYNEKESKYVRRIFKSRSINFDEYYYPHLEKVCKPEFLNTFFKKINAELTNRQFCLYNGNPPVNSFSKDRYYYNQALIATHLENRK